MFNKKYLFPLFGVLTVVFAVMSYSRGMSADINGDYHIYWEAGRNFINGAKIYTPGLLDGGFTYPPFAAMFFSVFSEFSFHTSAAIYSFFINYGLWVVSLALVKKIFNTLYPKENINRPFMLAAVLSIGFYWHNYIWMNANLPVLCCTLLGIQYYINKRYNLSYLFFLAGMFFKITPVLFLIGAAIKRGPKDWPKIILLSLPFILLPMLLRGFSRGMQDWLDYHEAFVAPFSKGQIDQYIISLGIPALLNKLNTGYAPLKIAPLFHLSEAGLKTMILALQATAITAVILKFLYDKLVKHNEHFSVADFCLLFMITLLLPGRVWTHHHVCAGFIYTYLFIVLRKQKVLYGVTLFLCLLLNFINKDVLGQYLSDVLIHYSLITLVMLLITILIIWYGYFERDEVEGV